MENFVERCALCGKTIEGACFRISLFRDDGESQAWGSCHTDCFRSRFPARRAVEELLGGVRPELSSSLEDRKIFLSTRALSIWKRVEAKVKDRDKLRCEVHEKLETIVKEFGVGPYNIGTKLYYIRKVGEMWALDIGRVTSL